MTEKEKRVSKLREEYFEAKARHDKEKMDSIWLEIKEIEYPREKYPGLYESHSPRSGGKGMIRVRSHARKGTKGVRAHTRKR